MIGHSPSSTLYDNVGCHVRRLIAFTQRIDKPFDHAFGRDLPFTEAVQRILGASTMSEVEDLLQLAGRAVAEGEPGGESGGCHCCLYTQVSDNNI